MAEHFHGRHKSVHFTNGGGELLLEALSKLAGRMTINPVQHEVTEFLQARWRSEAYGFRCFSLHPPPLEINSDAHLIFLAQVVAAFAKELTSANTDPTLTDISWDEEPRVLRWLPRIAMLYEIVGEALSSQTLALPPLDLGLSANQQILFQQAWAQWFEEDAK